MTIRSGAAPEVIFQEQAALFKALGDATRLKILSLLIEENGNIDVNGLIDRLDSLTQSTVSHHLLLLGGAGLIEYRKQGSHAFYYVKSSRLDEAKEIIALYSGRIRQLM